MLRAWQLQAGSAADCFTRKMAGTDRIFRWGQNHREMPAGTAYHHKERNKERFRGIKFSVNLGNLLTAQNAPPLSCADVQEEATAGSAKPRRKACSVGRAGGRPGAWGNPNKRAGISQKDIPAHCLPTLSEISDTAGFFAFPRPPRNDTLTLEKRCAIIPLV